VFNFSKHKIKNTKTISKKLIYFGIPVFATSIGGKIIGYIDTLILTYFVSLTEVGIYNVVLPSALMFIFFSKAICSVIFPMSSELWTLNNKKILIKGISIIHKYIFIIITPIILTAVYFSPALIRLLFGIEYVSGSLAFQILLLGVIFYVVASINNNLISGIGKPKTVTLIILSSAILNIILNIILIPKYSINGAAFATSISYLFMFVFSMYKAKKIIGLKFLIKEKLLTLISASFFYTTIILVEKSLNLNLILEVIISSIIATFVYLTLTYLFKLIDVAEVKRYTKF
jgi:O-antigen/teichoic acid export membrane protein